MTARVRILRGLLRLYPSWWQAQYGHDSRDLVEQLTSDPRATAALVVDLVRGVLDARLSGYGRPRPGTRGAERERRGHRRRTGVLIVGTCAGAVAVCAAAVGWGPGQRSATAPPTAATTAPAAIVASSTRSPAISWLCSRAEAARTDGQSTGFLSYVGTQCAQRGVAAFARSLGADGRGAAPIGALMCRYAAMQVADGSATPGDRQMDDSCRATPPGASGNVDVTATRIAMPTGLRDVNAWYGSVDGAQVAVYAGTASGGSGGTGEVVVDPGVVTAGDIHRLPGSGAATITSAVGNILTIRTATGGVYTLDVGYLDTGA